MDTCAMASAALMLSSCYSPSLRDCTVSCTGASDCASSQVCGDDGLCAAPEVAGHCATAMVDAGADPPRDAAVDAAPDAPVLTRLNVQVDGEGSVVVDGRGVCSSQDAPHGRCMYDIPLGISQRVSALPIRLDQVFVGWTSMTCSGEGSTCSFVPTTLAPITVTAKFGHPGSH